MTGPFFSLLEGVVYAETEAGFRLGALCSIAAGPNWLINIPRVVCHESWIRRHVDWHAYSDGELCVDLPARWFNQISPIAELFSSVEVERFAADYLLNSTAWLISRHRFGFEHALTEWPGNWPCWPHGRAGEAEYFQALHAA